MCKIYNKNYDRHRWVLGRRAYRIRPRYVGRAYANNARRVVRISRQGVFKTPQLNLNVRPKQFCGAKGLNSL